MALFTSLYASKNLGQRPEGPLHDYQLEGEKKVQKAVPRRAVDFTSSYVKMLQAFSHTRDFADGSQTLQPTAAAALDLLPPLCHTHQPSSSFNTKFVNMATNKVRCSVNVAAWTPDGRRCMTGTQSGEFTLWNGRDYNFETILQAHEHPLRCMVYSHNENYLLAGDDGGTVKYWKTNLELMKAMPAHRESVRAIAFSPTDLKFATCSDDSTVKVWDFARALTEQTLTGHGGDVKALDWHPHRSLLASGSKDGLVKLWDAKSGTSLATLHAHKATVQAAAWNQNGNWLLTASRDQLCKVFDVRMLKELALFKGHAKDVMCAAWHPQHEELFASGAHDGSLLFWLVSRQPPQAEVRGAHDAAVWSLHWHPVGHVLASASGDHSAKFWCRTRPGDPWHDREDGGDAGGTKASGVARGAAMLAAGLQAGVIPGIGEAAADTPPPDAAGLPPALAPGRALLPAGRATGRASRESARTDSRGDRYGRDEREPVRERMPEDRRGAAHKRDRRDAFGDGPPFGRTPPRAGRGGEPPQQPRAGPVGRPDPRYARVPPTPAPAAYSQTAPGVMAPQMGNVAGPGAVVGLPPQHAMGGAPPAPPPPHMGHVAPGPGLHHPNGGPPPPQLYMGHGLQRGGPGAPPAYRPGMQQPPGYAPPEWRPGAQPPPPPRGRGQYR